LRRLTNERGNKKLVEWSFQGGEAGPAMNNKRSEGPSYNIKRTFNVEKKISVGTVSTKRG